MHTCTLTYTHAHILTLTYARTQTHAHIDTLHTIYRRLTQIMDITSLSESCHHHRTSPVPVSVVTITIHLSLCMLSCHVHNTSPILLSVVTTTMRHQLSLCHSSRSQCVTYPYGSRHDHSASPVPLSVVTITIRHLSFWQSSRSQYVTCPSVGRRFHITCPSLSCHNHRVPPVPVSPSVIDISRYHLSLCQSSRSEYVTYPSVSTVLGWRFAVLCAGVGMGVAVCYAVLCAGGGWLGGGWR